jgi:Phosphatidylinositol N-acetylglucosaminyltransferase
MIAAHTNSAATSSSIAHKEQRCLWKTKIVVDDFGYVTTGSIAGTTTPDNVVQAISYDAVYKQFAIRPNNVAKRTLFRYIANSIVVVQEFVLSSYFLGWHRIMILQQRQHTNRQMSMVVLHPGQHFLLDISMMIMYVALFVAVVFNARAVTAIDTMQSKTYATAHKYRAKVFHRIIDAIIIACLLRYVAALLHNLTVSYSTDTVEMLVISLMTSHVVFCDYSYANGYRGPAVNSESAKSESNNGHEQRDLNKQLDSHRLNLHMENHRPPFKGGTMSLNAAFFATILLVSRLQESYDITSTSSFTFVSLSVILFAFYPVTRHTISVVYPPSRSGTLVRTSYACHSYLQELRSTSTPPTYVFQLTILSLP